jgi:hypothetical protein
MSRDCGLCPMTGNPEVISSPVELVPRNALVVIDESILAVSANMTYASRPWNGSAKRQSLRFSPSIPARSNRWLDCS